MVYRFSNSNQVPSLHLSGNWLQKAGFETGNYTTLFVSKGLIVIRKEEELMWRCEDVKMWKFGDLEIVIFPGKFAEHCRKVWERFPG